MASTTATFPGSVTSTSVFGTNPWDNANNIKVDDGSTATCTDISCGNDPFSEELRAYNFGFAIPSGATIDGIEAVVERFTDVACVRPLEYVIQLGKTSGRVGTNKAANEVLDDTEVVVFGGPTDLWGTTWTVSDINSSNFGLHQEYNLEANLGSVYIDRVTIKVYYTEGSGSGGSSGAGIGSKFFLLFA